MDSRIVRVSRTIGGGGKCVCVWGCMIVACCVSGIAAGIGVMCAIGLGYVCVGNSSGIVVVDLGSG